MANKFVSRSLSASNKNTLVLWYANKVNWTQRLLALLGISLIVAVLTITMQGNLLVTLPATAILLAAAHISLTTPGLISAVVVYLINALFIPTVAQAFALSSRTFEDQITILATTVIALLGLSTIWAFLAYKFLPGKLWVSLLFIYSLQAVGSVAFVMFTGVATSALVAPVFAGLAFWLRKRFYPHKSYAILPSPTKNIAKNAYEAVRTSTNAKVLGYVDKPTPTIYAATSRGVVAFYPFSTNKPLTFNNGTLQYEGKSLDNFCVALLQNSADAAPNKKSKIHTVILVRDSGLRNSTSIPLQILDNNRKVVGSVTFMDPSNLDSGIKKLPHVDYSESVVEALKDDLATSAV